jgi:ABC-type sugar transport system ATPase subunit
MKDCILKIKKISKSFQGVNALSDVSFDIKKGSIHALLGENGAGKSTLVKIISGIYKPDDGEINFDGNRVLFTKPREAKEAGIAVVHQEIKLVDFLSVAENIYLGEPFCKGIFVDFKRLYKESENLIKSLGLTMDVTMKVGDLSIAQQQITEICKALKNNAKLMIMDEPSATLTEHEMTILFRIIENLKHKGITIIYISHRLEEIFKIADNLTVLRDGRHIKTTEVASITKHELIKLMVGRELVEEYPKYRVDIGESVLEVKNLTRGKRVFNADFYLRKGEILGISGLIGAGRTELMRAVLGIDKYQRGQITIFGKTEAFSSFKQAINHRMGFIPEDRKKQGLVLDMNVNDNIFIVYKKENKRKLFIEKKKEAKIANDYIEKLNIQTPGIYSQTVILSGGNQQKVVVAKWLNAESDIIIVDEPTRGIDVMAKTEIYKLMNKMVESGKSIIMISSEMPELIGMCDRIYVMHEGRIKGELQREQFSQEKIMQTAMS